MSELDRSLLDLTVAFKAADKDTPLPPQAARLFSALAGKRFSFAHERWHDVGASLHLTKSHFPSELLLRPFDENGPFTAYPGIQAMYKAGLAVPFDKVIVSAAQKLLTDFNCAVSINISARSVESPAFLEWINASVTEKNATKTVFEITEDAPADNVCLSEIASLRTRGCRFAVDDFSHEETDTRLKNLSPVTDYVKIDGPSVEKGLADHAFMTSLISRIRTLSPDSVLIAERARRPADVLSLYDMGVDGIQQRALPASAQMFSRQMQSFLFPPGLKPSIV